MADEQSFENELNPDIQTWVRTQIRNSGQTVSDEEEFDVECVTWEDGESGVLFYAKSDPEKAYLPITNGMIYVLLQSVYAAGKLRQVKEDRKLAEQIKS